MSATMPTYPLEGVIDIKKRRVAQAEKVVKEKKRLLDTELEKLKLCEEERDKVKRHKQDKLNQLRDELDKGTTSDKILSMKYYLKVVDERVVVEQKKVDQQKGQVKIAEKNLETAKEELRMRRQEVDKLKTHKVDWTKQMRREMEIIQEKEMDEIGQVLYSVHQRKGY